MSGGFYYSVADEIFKKYPGYVRGVVLAFGVKNGETPSELAGLLRQAEAAVRVWQLPPAYRDLHPEPASESAV